MARAYGRFTTTIWLDPDFTSLTLAQQGAYFTLGLQPDVSAAGVLPFTSRRWSKLSADMKRDDIERMVSELEDSDGRHLIVDEDTEEVLIRKFIKWDMGWANTQKRLKVVLDAVDAISSDKIRHAAVAELWKVTTSELGNKASRDALSRELQIRYPDSADTVTRSDRVVVNEGEYRPEPQPLTLQGEPAGASASPPSMFCSQHPNGTEEACGPCGTAKAAYKVWATEKMQREVDAKRRAAEARSACELCDERGMRLHPESRLPVGRCTHQPAHSTADDTEATA